MVYYCPMVRGHVCGTVGAVALYIIICYIFPGMPKSFMTDKGREWARLKEKMPIISMRSVFNQVANLNLFSLDNCSGLVDACKLLESHLPCL